MTDGKGSRPAHVGSAAGCDDLPPDRGAGTGFEAVLAAAPYRRVSGLAPPAALRRLAWALRNPVPPARDLVDLALRLGGIALGSASAHSH